MTRELSGQACECAACGLQFRSVRDFDKHRVGTYQPNTRRCLSGDEMAALGMVEAQGRWRRKPKPFPGIHRDAQKGGSK